MELWWCVFCGEHHEQTCPKHHHRPHRRRLIVSYLSQEGIPIMASTPLEVPAGTTTVYASVDNYVDAAGAPTTDVAVSGTWTVDNGGSAAPDVAGLTATVTIVAGAGTTTISFSGLDAAGNVITASNTVTEAAATPPPANPAVSADVVLSLTPPAPAAVPAAEPVVPIPPA